MKKTNLSIGAIIVMLIAAYFGFDLNTQKQSNPQDVVNHQNQSIQTHQPATGKSEIEAGLDQIRKAYDQKQSDVQVKASGRVKAILADDNEGSRHQKFILSLNNGLTVLVAHNIDLAPRIEGIMKGDEVEFYGEYEYSDKGGVIHWTHHDPQNRHVGGWLKHKGKIYQ